MLENDIIEDDAISRIIDFWCEASADWFSHNPDFDAAFRERFAELYRAAREERLNHWAETPLGALALLVLLDQYPRNAFRGRANMYATDRQARQIARLAMERDFIESVPKSLQVFMILPFAHSESRADQSLSVELHRRFVPSGLKRAKRHRAIIERFGRFPHRNETLGRPSRPEEDRYLKNGGFQG